MYLFETIKWLNENIKILILRLISALSIIISGVIVTRLFSKEELSLYYLLVPISSFFTMILISPISIFRLNKCIEGGSDIFDYVTGYFCYLLTVGFVLAVIFLTFYNDGDFSLKLYFAIYIFIEIIIGSLAGMVVQDLSVYGKLGKSAFISLIISLITIAAPCTLGFCFNWNLKIWLMGLILSRIIQIPIIFFTIKQYVKYDKLMLKFNDILKDLFINWRSVCKLVLISILNWMSQNCGKFLLSTLIGLTHSGPYLFILSISATMASVLEGITRPILDRNMFTTVRGLVGVNNKINTLYYLIGLVGFVSLPYLSNSISAFRFEDIVDLSRIVFLYELARLFLAYKLSIYQINSGYNLSLKINLFILILQLVLLYLFISIFNGFISLALLFSVLLVVVVIISRRIEGR